VTDAVVRVWLKVVDPTALTARETLQRPLGYGRSVTDVARSEVWGFRFRSEAAPRSVLERLVAATTLLANPNKHRVEIRVGEESLSPRGNAWVLVHTPGAGGDLARAAARHRLLSGETPVSARGILWELDLAAAPAERPPLALEMAVARERRRGLLANPHVEAAHVFVAPPTAAALARVLHHDGGAGDTVQ
jgi:phosphoribosylformylglycinamidine (FGAM) synthase PurS component